MVEIKDFLPRKHNLKTKMKEAFENGNHYEWISFGFMWMEELLRIYLLMELKSRNKDINEITKWITDVAPFNVLLKNSYMFGLIPKELYTLFKKIARTRNKIIHKLLLGYYKDLEKIKLEDLYADYMKTFDQLMIHQGPPSRNRKGNNKIKKN